MKKTIINIILLTGIILNIFAQQEIPMFFDNELGLQPPGNIGFTRRVIYNPDGNRIATTFRNGRIAIWDATTGREIIRMTGHSEPVTGIVFSPNGRLLVSCSGRDTNIKIWDAITGELIRNIPQANATNISFSPDGNRIGSTNLNNETRNIVRIWSITNGNELMTLIGHSDGVRSLTYSPDGRQIMTSSYDGTIKIWNAGNGQVIRTIDSGIRFESAVYSPNGRFIAAHIHDRRSDIETIRIYNAETGQEIRSIPAELSRNLIYSPDGRQLLVNAWIDNGNTKIIKIFDPETGRELQRFNIGDFAAAYSPDGRRILTDSRTFELRFEDNFYGASFANIIDATTGRNVGVIGYGPLNIGARAFADLQIARFLGDNAAVSRHEAVLQWIISSGNVTRAEVEAFYRNNVRTLVSEVVDAEFRGVTVPAATVAEIKKVIGDFFTSPTQATLRTLLTERLFLVNCSFAIELHNSISFQRQLLELGYGSENEININNNELNVILRNIRDLKGINFNPSNSELPNDIEYRFNRILNVLNTEFAKSINDR